MRTILAGAMLVLVSTTAAIAGDPAVTCETSKLKEVGKYFFCRMKADALAAKTGTSADYSTCTGKFNEKFAAQETKAGPGVCPTEGNVAAVESCVAQATAECADLVQNPGPDACDTGTCGQCQTCVQQPGGSCNDEAATCLDDPECTAIANCVTGCMGNLPCADQCRTDHPDGQAEWDAYVNCVFTTCEITC